MKLNDISKQLDSALDARMLVKHVTGLSDADLIVMDDIQLTPDQQTQLNDYIQQRVGGRPIAKIIGYKEFYGRNFIVSDDVLDPRPDSETLIECVLDYAKDKKNFNILDLGTGSGCLILTLLAELQNATAIATDISSKALNIAQQNADALGVSDRVEFRESDWFDNVNSDFDIIISNPPYIESYLIPKLDIDVRDFDPILALDGGENGLNPYEVILPQIRSYLKKGGFVALEHGVGQCGRIEGMLKHEGLSDIRMHKDLSDRNRIISAIHK